MEAHSAHPSGCQQERVIPLCVPDHELIRPIGQGSYGEVWLARHARLGTLRAVKFVRRDQFDDARPFQREFDGIRRYEPISRAHPNLVAILHVGGTDDCFFYVMELADSANSNECLVISNRSSGVASAAGTTPPLNPDYSSRTLRSELKRHGALPIDRCLEIGLALAGALAHLHGRGLMHRDVKPSNVIFVGGVAKLADIGLVAPVSDSHSFVGTEGYIPPEGPGTPSADCYALGKLLYELSTGHDRTAWSEPPADLPTRRDREHLLELNAIIHKACAADARQRYRSAEEMHAELALLKRGESLKHKRVVEGRFVLVKTVSAFAVAMLIIAAGAGFMARALTQRAREGRVQQRGTLSMEAWNLYQKGRFLVESQNAKELLTAIDYFQQAIQLDPKFARAHEWLGSAYANLVFHTKVPARECFTKAELSVRRALELDPTQAEAWSGLGFIKTKYGTNLDEAERLLRHSVQMDPNNLVCLHRLAICLSDRGKSEESIALHKRILEVDPTKLDFNRSFGLRLFQARHFDEAISALQRTVELHPNNALAWTDLGAALAHVGRNDEAATALCTAKRLKGANDTELAEIKSDYVRIGIKAFWVKDALRPGAAGTNYFPAFGAARRCVRAGDYEGAIQWLQRLEHDPLEYSRALLSPEFDLLRSDARFVELSARIGLPAGTR